MQFKPFTPADKAEYLAMCRDFYTCGATAFPISEAQMEATFDYVAAGTPYAFGFILEHAGSPAGYALGYPFYSNEAGCLCLMLEEIYIKPAWRSHRLGGDYLRAIAPEMERRLGLPIGALKLECCPGNERARKLYERLGFCALPYCPMVQKREI